MEQASDRMSFRSVKYPILALLLLTLLSCCGRRPLSEEKMAGMLAEMYLLDQWINDPGRRNGVLDTVLVYGGILDAYGVSEDDFRRSLDYWLRDPQVFYGILGRSREILSGHLSVLTAQDSLARRNDSIRNARLERMKTMDLPRMYKDILVGFFPTDTVCPGPDSLRYSFAVPVLDTMFDGPRLVIREHAAADSVSAGQADSLALSVLPGAEVAGDSVAVQEKTVEKRFSYRMSEN